MESHRQLDVAGRTAATRHWISIRLALVVLSFTPLVSDAQTSTELQLMQFADQERWTEIVREAEVASARDADTNFYYGIALAQLGRLDDARRSLLAGYGLQPRDKRFPIELGGVDFKQKRYPEAARWVHRALRIDPQDSYANDLLGTIYFLEGNLEAALKYWNRAGKPQIENVLTPPELKIQPALLDRVFAFSPASLLRLQDLLTSEKRVAGLGVFPQYGFDLAARDDGRFDVNFHAQELNGFGPNRWAALLSFFRGVSYQTVYPEYFNTGSNAGNINALVRWDAQKRRLAVSYSSPLEHNPKYRYQLGADLRDENWMIVPSFQKLAPLLGALNLQTQVASGRISSFNAGPWDWSMGAEISHRQYRNVVAGTALAPSVLLTGYEAKQIARLNRQLLRIPEKRFLSTTSVSAETARIWSNPSHSFEKLQASLRACWLPRMSGDDYAVEEQVRAGKTFGQLPFDELFMLGLERDNDLWMRAHIGTRDGRKGSAPLGRNYFLSNWEIDKNVYHNGLFGVKLSPFLDSGKITDPLPGLGSKKWLWDAGIQAKISVLGVGFTFTYGKDLRSGNNTSYLTARP
jgi:tetratricopeptide (TPR) repeat protein